MKARAASPDVLVDLADLAELRTISFSADQSALELGAMVTNTQLIASSEVEVARPILAEVAATIADVQIRNRGTIGGNVCVNDPTNHFPPLLVALGASFTIRGAAGERTVSAEEFFLGVYLTAVGEGELLTKISVPTRKPGTGDAMEGVTLGAHGTYIVNAAATVGRGRRRASRSAASRRVPVRATAMEERLAAGDFSEAAVRAAAAGLGESLDPPSDVHAQRRLPPAPGRGLGRARGPASSRASEGVSVPTTPRAGRSRSRSTARPTSATFPRRSCSSTSSVTISTSPARTSAATRAAAAPAPCSSASDAVKSCCMLAVQADGASITTVEGLASDDGELTPLQESFHEHHGLQCGYCTPGMLMSATALLEQNPRPSEHEVKVALQGNICRCTGYWNIVEAVVAAGEAGAR